MSQSSPSRPAGTPSPRRRPRLLAGVVRLLRSDPRCRLCSAWADGTFAVPEAAQAVAVAALAAFTERSPLLVITATGLDADRLADDLGCLVGRRPRGGAGGAASDDDGAGQVAGALDAAVVALPAWETLPFERVSPEIETMGRRLAVLESLRGRGEGPADPALPPPPRIVVARCGRSSSGSVRSRPVCRWSSAGAGGRRRRAARRAGRPGLPARAPGGAPWRIRRARRDRGRLPLYLRRPGAPRPVGRRGRPPHGVLRQRPAVVPRPGRGRPLRVPRAVPSPELRAAAEALVAARPWGVSVWDRLAHGEQFDGMESWLPVPRSGRRVLPDLLPAGAQVVLVEPRRIRDRGVQLLDEEAALAETLAATWGAGRGGEPSLACTCPSTAAARQPCRRGVAAAGPRGPGRRRLTVGGSRRWPGDPDRLAAAVSRLVGEGYAVTLCAATAAGAARLSGRAGGGGRARPGVGVGAGARRARAWWSHRWSADSSCPSEGGGALGDRRHRPAGAAPPGPSPGPRRRWVLRRSRRLAASWSTANTAWRASRASRPAPWAGPRATT